MNRWLYIGGNDRSKITSKRKHINSNIKKVSWKRFWLTKFKKCIIEQYTCKKVNANQWMNSFEKECERFHIIEDGRKIERLWYFLDKASLDWYNSRILMVTIKDEIQLHMHYHLNIWKVFGGLCREKERLMLEEKQLT